MSGRILIRPKAAVDVENCSFYLLERSLDAAIRFADAVSSAFEQLACMPGMGGLREFPNPEYANVRSWPITGFENYLIFYVPIPDGIEVIRVIHGARNIDFIFGARKK